MVYPALSILQPELDVWDSILQGHVVLHPMGVLCSARSDACFEQATSRVADGGMTRTRAWRDLPDTSTYHFVMRTSVFRSLGPLVLVLGYIPHFPSCASSLRRGHADILCTGPMSTLKDSFRYSDGVAYRRSGSLRIRSGHNTSI